jgi:hypothetical protein
MQMNNEERLKGIAKFLKRADDREKGMRKQIMSRRLFVRTLSVAAIGAAGIMIPTSAFACGATQSNTGGCSGSNSCGENTCPTSNTCDPNSCNSGNTCTGTNSCTTNTNDGCAPNQIDNGGHCATTNDCAENKCKVNECKGTNVCEENDLCAVNNTCDINQCEQSHAPCNPSSSDSCHTCNSARD